MRSSSVLCSAREAGYLDPESIEHTRTKIQSPQTGRICEHSHLTMKNECYANAFRPKLCRTIEELRGDVDAWVERDNTERTHSGRSCYGSATITGQRSQSRSVALPAGAAVVDARPDEGKAVIEIASSSNSKRARDPKSCENLFARRSATSKPPTVSATLRTCSEPYRGLDTNLAPVLR